jgi:uncharacterized membrane protein YdjX (TVP38/TMEM64 family)
MPRTRRILALIGFPLLLAALFVPVIVFRREIWGLFTSTQRLQDWVSSSGPVAPLVFIGIQAIQVIVFVIPGEVPQIAGGFLFGAWLGTALSVAGILAGSTVTFFLARALGVPFVHALFPEDQVRKIEKLLGSRSSRLVFFLLFLIPGIPKDILCYVAGLSPMRFWFFMAASFAGRLPGILGSAMIGEAAAGKKWVLVGVVGGAALLLFGAGVLLRRRIEEWLTRMAERRRGGPPAPPATP